MATIALSPQTLSASFTLSETEAGLIRDQHEPTAAAARAEVVPDGLAAVR
jgi:hypothetical protein